jgi:hypothetical protein
MRCTASPRVTLFTYSAHTQSAGSFEEPLFPASEMGSIIPADTKKPFDIRKVIRVKMLTVWCWEPISYCGCVLL